MALPETIRTEMTAAMRAGDARRRDTLRLLLAALANARIAVGHDLGEEEAVRVLQREAKQRHDSIEEFRRGSRADLVAREEEELRVLAEFLPSALPDEEVESLARAVIAEVGATAPADLGTVMRPLMERLAGRADGRRVSELVRGLLGGA